MGDQKEPATAAITARWPDPGPLHVVPVLCPGRVWTGFCSHSPGPGKHLGETPRFARGAQAWRETLLPALGQGQTDRKTEWAYDIPPTA